MPKNTERIEDRLADFTRDKRVLGLSLMALVMGAFEARFIPVGDAGAWSIVGMAAMMVARLWRLDEEYVRERGFSEQSPRRRKALRRLA
jgi:hypothetical protein